jgi:Flp pilus assembly protein TadG
MRHDGMRKANAEAGSATTELVIIVPVLLLSLLLIFQFGLWYQARHVALAAAEEGARAARVDTGSAEAGAARAQRFLRQLGPSIVVDPQVGASRTQEVARVVVSGHALNVVPWLHLPIRQSSEGPIERFRTDVPGFANSEAPSGGNSSEGGP